LNVEQREDERETRKNCDNGHSHKVNIQNNPENIIQRELVYDRGMKKGRLLL